MRRTAKGSPPASAIQHGRTERRLELIESPLLIRREDQSYLRSNGVAHALDERPRPFHRRLHARPTALEDGIDPSCLSVTQADLMAHPLGERAAGIAPPFDEARRSDPARPLERGSGESADHEHDQKEQERLKPHPAERFERSHSVAPSPFGPALGPPDPFAAEIPIHSAQVDDRPAASAREVLRVSAGAERSTTREAAAISVEVARIGRRQPRNRSRSPGAPRRRASSDWVANRIAWS